MVTIAYNILTIKFLICSFISVIYVCTFIFPKRYESVDSNDTINLDKIIFIFGIVYEIIFLSNSYCEMPYIKNINTIFKAFVLHISKNKSLAFFICM